MEISWDVFFSYRRSDFERARPLLNALSEAGIRVWRDETDIPDQGSITAEIRRAIAGARAFLAFYCCTYPLSSPCQQEITIAWLAAEHLEQDPRKRVWIVNPEAGFDHVPELLRDQQILKLGDAGSQAIAAIVKSRLASIERTLDNGVRELPRYLGMTPVQSRRFVRRTREFWDLHSQLTARRLSIITGSYGQNAAQVRGLGGNGKSLLAREYSIRFGPAYPGGVFWLNAYGNDDTRGTVDPEQRERLRHDQIRQFAVQYSVPAESLTPSEIETRFWHEIERRGERCLWIVDGMPSGLTPAGLENWCARWPGASTLITTRSKEYGAVGNTLDLGVLSSGEAFDLLCAHCRPANSVEEKAAHQIAELLGYHPLAVEVAGRYIAQGLDTFESYGDALASPSEDAVEFGNSIRESLPTGHETSISATLLKSIRQLEPEGLDFLRLASVLAVAPIEVSFVSEVFGLLQEHGRKARSIKAVDQAGVLSLCDRFGENARAVHTLVSRTMRFLFQDEQRTHDLRSAAVVALTLRFHLTLGFQQVEHIGQYFKIATDIPHVRHLVSGSLQTEQEIALAARVARRDYQRSDYSAARRLHEQVPGEEDPARLKAMNNLAQTLWKQGDMAGARSLQEQVLAGARRVLGEEHPHTLTAMINLAQTLWEQGDAAGARPLQQQVVAVRRRVLGEEHPATLTAMNNLAQNLWEQGDAAGARSLQEQVLAGMRRVLGEEHPNTLTTMNNLAEMLAAQGDAGARLLQEQVLAGMRRVLGEEHPATLKAMNNLALTLWKQGDMAGARSLQEQVLAGMRRVLGEEHPATLTTMDNLAQTLWEQGDAAGARRLQQQVVAMRRRVLGEEHPATLMAMNNLADTLGAQGDAAGARRLQKQVVAGFRRVLGSKHPLTLKAMRNLAKMT